MFHCLPDWAWAKGNLAKAARQVGKMGEHPNQSQPNPTQVSEQMNHPVLPRSLSLQLQCCGVDSSEDFSLAVEFIKYTNEANAGQVVPEVRD